MTEQADVAKKLNDAALVIVDRVKLAEVTSQDSKDGAVAFGQEIVTEIGVREDFFRPMRVAAFKAHKTVCDQEKASIDQLASARDDLAAKIAAWTDAQERLAEEARKKAEAEERAREEERRKKAAAEQAERERKIKEAADKEAERLRKIRAAEEAEAERKRKLEEAEAAKQAGDEEKADDLTKEAEDDKSASEELREEAQADQDHADDLVKEVAAAQVEEPEPEPEPIQPAVAAPAKTKGGVTRKVYSAVVIDLNALITAVAAGKAPRRCITIDQAYLDKAARMDKEDMDIPGVELKIETKQDFKKLRK